MKLRDKRPFKLPFEPKCSVRIGKQIIMMKVHEFRLVCQHFLQYSSRVMVVAEHLERRKPVLNGENFDRAHAVKLVNLFFFRVLVKSVEQWIPSFFSAKTHVLEGEVWSGEFAFDFPAAETLIVQQKRQHSHVLHLSFLATKCHERTSQLRVNIVIISSLVHPRGPLAKELAEFRVQG